MITKLFSRVKGFRAMRAWSARASRPGDVTLPVANFGLHGRWCPRSDLHRHCARFKGAASALGYVGKLVPWERICTHNLPETGTPGRNLTCNLRVRHLALVDK